MVAFEPDNAYLTLITITIEFGFEIKTSVELKSTSKLEAARKTSFLVLMIAATMVDILIIVETFGLVDPLAPTWTKTSDCLIALFNVAAIAMITISSLSNAEDVGTLVRDLIQIPWGGSQTANEKITNLFRDIE